MKIKTVDATYREVLALPHPHKKRPKRPNFFFRTLVRLLSAIGMAGLKCSFEGERINKKDGPYLILMNHSSFLDMQIASKLLYPMPYGIVTTTDGFIGKSWLMRQIGCIPTQKFVSDIGLIRSMEDMLRRQKTSVLMFPEAGYSLDGRATVLPRKLGGLLKLLKVPVLFIFAEGPFWRTPLYNELRNRKVPIRARARVLFTREEIAERSAEELEDAIQAAFSFDHFKRQRELGLRIEEPYRAQGLERVLYKCPRCGTEGEMHSKGAELFCSACHTRYEMTPLGEMRAMSGDTEYAHIPDWVDWQRACVREELENGTYRLCAEVDVAMIVDDKALYRVGKGKLVHDCEGFHLSGCDGELMYEQKPLFSYSLNADYYWYEIGDVIGIGGGERLYYCFPGKEVSVTKARLATEELYKMVKQ